MADFSLDPNDPRNRDRFSAFTPTPSTGFAALDRPPRPPGEVGAVQPDEPQTPSRTVTGYRQAGTQPLTAYLSSGKGPESANNLTPVMQQRLSAMLANAPPQVRDNISIYSGWRSNDHQAQLYAAAVQKYGPDRAGHYVAPPGHSYHNKGEASDLEFKTPEARQWTHDNAGQFGLKFPMGHEPWHIEVAETRGGKQFAGKLPGTPGDPPSDTPAPVQGPTTELAAKAAPATPLPTPRPAAADAAQPTQQQAFSPTLTTEQKAPQLDAPAQQAITAAITPQTPSTGDVAAAATKPFFRTASPNYPPAANPGYGLPPQLPVSNAPGTSVPFPMRRPATAPTAVPQAAPGPTPVATATEPAATGASRSAAPPPAPPGARNAGASPTAVPKAAPGPTPVATAAQPAATGAVRAAAGGPTLGEAIIKSMGPRGAGMSTYVDPGTGHQVINPGGSGEQAMGITRDIGPVRQTVSRLAPAAPQRPVAPQPPGAGTTAAPAVQPVSPPQPVTPPKPDFAGPNAPVPFTGSVPNAPGQPPPGSFASRFPGGDRFNFMGPTPPAPDAAGVLAAPTVNQPQQPLPPQPQPYPSVTEQLPPGFNVFAGSPQPPPTSISQLPWWPFLDGGGGGNALAYSGDWGSGY